MTNENAKIKIALAGNPNSGKTTLFNALTGSNQFVGNWPGVTVEKKEGKLKGYKNVGVIDLPGIYSLSPYTLEEVVSRNFLTDESPDVILDIADGTNLERNLYLTTQIMELGIPVVVAVNMMDVVKKSGGGINLDRMTKALGCPIVEISALKGTGIMVAAQAAIEAAKGKKTVQTRIFSGEVESALTHIAETVLDKIPERLKRWYSIKLFERDKKIAEKLALTKQQLETVESLIRICEEEKDDESESVIATERYSYIDRIIADCCTEGKREKLSASDKIDKIVTNRFLAFPIFAAVMFIIYFVSVTTVGTLLTDWTNDGLFGEGWRIGTGFLGADSAGIEIPGIPVLVGNFLESVNCAEWLQSLILDGIIAGVGGVLGFVPQMLLLFLFLAFLEGCGYMARVAFILDRLFRKFGLSGKSFIPMLISSGCGVPGIMASRTIESDRDRKMTIITTTFVPCGAKLPMIALFSGALFGGAWWVAPSAYFIGVAAIVISGIILKKTKLFSGQVSPFVMELPMYHLPTAGNVLRSMWERGWSFIKKAGTVILVTSVFVWFASGFGWTDGSFGMVDMQDSILAKIGSGAAWIFAPLGWGNWQPAVASIIGLTAKENIVGTFGVLFGFAEGGSEGWGQLGAFFSPAAGYSFLVFNLLCAPCVAAIGAIRREMNNRKWFWFAILYQCLFAYIAAIIAFRVGTLLSGGGVSAGTIAVGAGVLIIVGIIIADMIKKSKRGVCAGCSGCGNAGNKNSRKCGR